MSREIEFRVWLGDRMDIVDTLHIEELGVNTRGINGTPCYRNYTKSILMQYTGRKDKNRKKIFEQDVVKLNGHLWEVYWNDEESCYKMKNNFDDLFLTKYKEKALEVIGNVYENKELLGEKKETTEKEKVEFTLFTNNLFGNYFEKMGNVIDKFCEKSIKKLGYKGNLNDMQKIRCFLEENNIELEQNNTENGIHYYLKQNHKIKSVLIVETDLVTNTINYWTKYDIDEVNNNDL